MKAEGPRPPQRAVHRKRETRQRAHAVVKDDGAEVRVRLQRGVVDDGAEIVVDEGISDRGDVHDGAADDSGRTKPARPRGKGSAEHRSESSHELVPPSVAADCGPPFAETSK